MAAHVEDARAVMAASIGRHDVSVMQVSGGKDSAACVKLLGSLPSAYADRVVVLWMNAGNPLPMVAEYMQRLRERVPHFVEIRGDQPRFIRDRGYPADLVPFEGSELGKRTSGVRGPRVVPMDECCMANFWRPMAEATQRSGATCLMRGERATDARRSVMQPGRVYGGMEFVAPVWGWSDEQVIEYLGDDLPPTYRLGLTHSVDCRNCTAHTDAHAGYLRFLREHDPETYGEIKPVVAWLREQTAEYLRRFDAEMEESHV